MGDEVEALVHRFPNVIAWVSGHTHENFIVPRPSDTGGFWDIGTAAHIDWSCQSRLIEVLDNRDGTLSIFCTMVDHAGDPTPGSGRGPVNLASIARELAANDYQYGFGSNGRGRAEDRNVNSSLRSRSTSASLPPISGSGQIHCGRLGFTSSRECAQDLPRTLDGGGALRGGRYAGPFAFGHLA